MSKFRVGDTIITADRKINYDGNDKSFVGQKAKLIGIRKKNDETFFDVIWEHGGKISLCWNPLRFDKVNIDNELICKNKK